MTPRRAALGLLLALALPSALPAAAEDNHVPEVLASTAVVRTESGTGSAFVVAPGRLMTAAHVVAGATSVLVVLGSGQHPATVLAADDAKDLALLAADVAAPALPFGPEPAPGATVYAVGNPLDGGLSASRGILSGARTVDGHRELQTDAAVNPGNSGGPLVDEQGRVVGVVVSKLRDADGIALAVPASTVSAFVASPRSVAATDPPSSAATPGAARDGRELPWVVGAAAALTALVALGAVRARRPSTVPAPDLEIVLHPAAPAAPVPQEHP